MVLEKNLVVVREGSFRHYYRKILPKSLRGWKPGYVANGQFRWSFLSRDRGCRSSTYPQRWPQNVIYSNLQFYCNVATELLLKTKKKNYSKEPKAPSGELRKKCLREPLKLLLLFVLRSGYPSSAKFSVYNAPSLLYVNFTKDKAQTKGKLKFFVSILTVHSVTNQNQIHYKKNNPMYPSRSSR